MSTTPDSFHRTDDFESRIDSVLLPDEAWSVFALLEKPCTVADIAQRLETDAASVQKTIDVLVENKLARKHLVNWRDFLAQKGIKTGPTRMSPAGPQPAPAAIAAVARREITPAAPTPQPAPPTPAAPATPAAAAPVPTPAASRAAAITRRPPARPVEPEVADPVDTITFTLTNEGARRSRRASLAMCITFRLGGSAAPAPVRIAPAAPKAAVPAPRPVEPRPEPVAAPEPERTFESTPRISDTSSARTITAPRKLRPLIDAITRKGGGGLNGQLLVYRVFLRVPPALMFQAGIKSLSLIDDTLELHDEQVYDVIRSAAQTVAKIDLNTVEA